MKNIGPCGILRKFTANAYEIELPDNVGISPIFNVANLYSYRRDEAEIMRWSKRSSVGRTISHDKKTLDGENHWIERWKKVQEEDISWVFSEVERSSNGRCKLGHRTWYFEAWKNSTRDHGQESMNILARGIWCRSITFKVNSTRMEADEWHFNNDRVSNQSFNSEFNRLLRYICNNILKCKLFVKSWRTVRNCRYGVLTLSGNN